MSTTAAPPAYSYDSTSETIDYNHTIREVTYDYPITIDRETQHMIDQVQYTINQPAQINFKVLSPAESALNCMVGRIKEFHQWLCEEQKDLEEECGADLSGLIDRLEENFPELSGGMPDHIAPVTDRDFDFTLDENGNIVTIAGGEQLENDIRTRILSSYNVGYGIGRRFEDWGYEGED